MANIFMANTCLFFANNAYQIAFLEFVQVNHWPHKESLVPHQIILLLQEKKLI
jgi:hypothetical protein